MKGCPICGGPIHLLPGLQRCEKCGHLMYGVHLFSFRSAREQLDEEYDKIETHF